MNRYSGNDNYGKPRQDYVNKVKHMDDDMLEEETESKIWLSAFAGNNPRSDYHWHVDALYEECQKRDPSGEMYNRAFKRASNS